MPMGKLPAVEHEDVSAFIREGRLAYHVEGPVPLGGEPVGDLVGQVSAN